MQTYPLLPTIDLPAIHAYAARCVPACVDWLQEVVAIDLGNLLWAFARAEGDAVEPMRDVLAMWLGCQGDEKGSEVASWSVCEERGLWFPLRQDGMHMGFGADKLGAWSGVRLNALALFDEDVRLVVAEIRPIDLWAKWYAPAGAMGTIGRLMADVLRPFGFLVDFVGWELTIPNRHTNEPTKMIRQVLLPSQFLYESQFLLGPPTIATWDNPPTDFHAAMEALRQQIMQGLGMPAHLIGDPRT